MRYALIIFAACGLSIGLTIWGVKLSPFARADAVLTGILVGTLLFAAITLYLFRVERRQSGEDGGLRQSMGWLHTWSGLLVGWVLFFVFLTGTTGYFDTEIDRWMQPERPLPQEAVSSVEDMASQGIAYLRQTAPRAKRWFIRFPDKRESDLFLFWQNPSGEAEASVFVTLDPETGMPVTHRETGGGQLLYRMHWQLHYLPRVAGEWVVVICALFMLVAIISGVITHKRIFRDFFTFRPRKGQRSWLDAHNLLSVAALPFHIMITYSGLIFYGYLYMAPVIAATYGIGGQGTYFDELYGRDQTPERAGQPAALIPIAPLLKQAQPVQYINIYHPGDANSRIVVYGGAYTPTRSDTELTFDGTTGDLLKRVDSYSAPVATEQTLIGLHEGLFAGPLLRWLYFLSGLTGTAMIGAGLILWTVKRRARGGAGLRLVEGLNLGTIIGLPIAIAAYFWANRLIPVRIEDRAAWEAHSMFIVWALMLLHAFLRPGRPGWTEQLAIAAAAFGLLPLLNWLTTDKHLGITLPAGVWELAGFDLTVLAVGLACALAAVRDQGSGDQMSGNLSRFTLTPGLRIQVNVSSSD